MRVVRVIVAVELFRDVLVAVFVFLEPVFAVLDVLVVLVLVPAHLLHDLALGWLVCVVVGSVAARLHGTVGEQRPRGAHHRRSVVVMRLICVRLQLLVVGVVEALELFLYRRSLAAADGAAAGMLLLLLHLAQDGILLHLDEGFALILAEAEPESFDPLPFLLGACVPYLLLGDARTARVSFGA